MKLLRWLFRIIVLGIVIANIVHFCGFILPNLDLLSTPQDQLIIIEESHLLNVDTDIDCVLPAGYPHGPPGWKRLIRICANLDQFSIQCHNKTCIECIPPWSHNPEWLYKFVKQFAKNEYESRDKRRNELRDIVENKLILKHKRSPIILMTLNNGYIYLFLNWVCSLESQQIADSVRSNSIIIVTDKKAQLIAQKAGFYVVLTDWVDTQDISIDEAAAESYALGAHRWTVSLQIVYTFDLINMGYNVIQQDVDVVWLKDVRPYFEDINTDISMICDGRLDYIGPGNSGFIYIESNCKTKVFLDTLMYYIGLVIHARSDQVAWNMFLTSYDFRQIEYNMLPPDKFVGGDAFGNGKNRKTKVSDHVLFLHASWTFQHGAKITKFKSINAWFLNETCDFYNKSIIPKHNEPEYYLLKKDKKWRWPDPEQDAWWITRGQNPPYQD